MAKKPTKKDKSPGPRLGVKAFGGQFVKAGSVIVRQVGTKFLPGENTFLGRDFTILSKVDGIVKFSYVSKNKQKVSVVCR